MNIALKMPFFILSNVEINFYDLKLSWMLYITTEIFSTTKSVELIRKKEFAVIALD